MIGDYLRLHLPIKDEEFDMIYSSDLRKISQKHFTEVDVAIKAAKFLVTKPGQKVLDIGSGVGKFCFVASCYSDAIFTGVDYREHYIKLCEKLADKYNFENVNFIHDDVVNIDFTKYDSFYFFNSFEEHADINAQMDDIIVTNREKFIHYTDFLKIQLDKLPGGTNLVTYFAYPNQIPNSYKLVSMHFGGNLKCWKKSHLAL